MIKLKDPKSCVGCYACIGICPEGAVAADMSSGYLVPRPDPRKCNDCGKCERVCPALNEPAKNVFHASYISYTEEESVRSASSAGGTFAMLALDTLSAGGAVFGAGYTDRGCEHICAESAAELAPLLGRKYVFSRIGQAFERCRDMLISGRKVLFCALPCQIEALRLFLGSPFDSLLCVEVGCGGVLSEMAWNSFLDSLGCPESVRLTNRVDGYNRAGMVYTYKDGQVAVTRSETSVHRAASLGLGIMPACEKCVRGRRRSSADITLRRYDPSVTDETLDRRRQPLSLVLVRTRAGMEAFGRVREVMCTRELPVPEAIAYIKNSVKEKKYSCHSAAFLKKLKNSDFDSALDACSRSTLGSSLGALMRSIVIK